jgi:hypothetical protein
MKSSHAIRILSFRSGHADMADAMFMFAVTAGIFVFMVAVVFGARAKRYSAGYTSSGGHAESHE